MKQYVMKITNRTLGNTICRNERKIVITMNT